jgi:hypothetical protein
MQGCLLFNKKGGLLLFEAPFFVSIVIILVRMSLPPAAFSHLIFWPISFTKLCFFAAFFSILRKNIIFAI